MQVVIFATSTPWLGGVGQYISYVLPHLLSRLRAKGCRSVVLLSHDSLLKCEPHGGRGVYLPSARGNRVARVALDDFYCWFLSWGADVFVSLQNVLPLVPLPARRTLAVVHDLRQLLGRAFLRQWGPNVPGSSERYWRACHVRTVRMADRIVADSDYVSGELRTAGKVSSDRIARVYAGVDRTRFRPITNSELVEGVRRRYHLPDQFYIFVGGLARGWKNLELIVRSYILSRGEPGLCLPVVITSGRPAGTRGYRALELIEENQMGHLFRFVGHIADDDLPAAYSMARGLLYPSLYEGFGMPPLEAMACGTPVVASNTTALPEIIADAGILIDPTSPESLLAALGRLNDPTVRGQMIQKGFNRARQFSWEQTAEELANEIVTLGA